MRGNVEKCRLRDSGRVFGRCVRRAMSGLSTSVSSSPSSATTAVFPGRFSIAPMMDYTDVHQRTLMRLITQRAVLYTEMVVAQALVNAVDKRPRFLRADFAREEPLVLQLGGSDPHMCHQAAKIAKEYGYKEINLNVGCPSDKVADAGCFGAALMTSPDLVSELVLRVNDAMLTGESHGCRPTTVKCRIGIDDMDSYAFVQNFVNKVHKQSGVEHFIVHARKAILGGKLSPAENRRIPPLKYDIVYQLVKDFPHLQFTINGGITSYEEIDQHLHHTQGVMIGRQIVASPYYWRNVDSLMYNDSDLGLSRQQILEQYLLYAENVIAQESDNESLRFHLRAMVKPLQMLFHGEPNSKVFRVSLTAGTKDLVEGRISFSDLVRNSAAQVPREVLDSTSTVANSHPITEE